MRLLDGASNGEAAGLFVGASKPVLGSKITVVNLVGSAVGFMGSKITVINFVGTAVGETVVLGALGSGLNEGEALGKPLAVSLG